MESDLDRAKDWDSAPFTAPEPDAVQDALHDWVVDLRENDRLSLSVQCQLATASTSILSAHRANRVSWQVPTSMAIGIDLVHSLALQDRCRAQGKVWSIIDEWDLQGQKAITTLVLAISRGGGSVSDDLVLPPPPDSQPEGEVPQPVQLPTQLRGRGLMTYDETMKGFSGNYDEVDIGTPTETFPRRYDVEAPEVPATHRDEFTAERKATYRVRIPNDLLEL
jgi:hypothetical protein